MTTPRTIRCKNVAPLPTADPAQKESRNPNGSGSGFSDEASARSTTEDDVIAQAVDQNDSPHEEGRETGRQREAPGGCGRLRKAAEGCGRHTETVRRNRIGNPEKFRPPLKPDS